MESTRTIEIDQFVDKTDIDPRYLIHPYYLRPDGKVGHDAFAVIRETIREMDKAAIGPRGADEPRAQPSSVGSGHIISAERTLIKAKIRDPNPLFCRIERGYRARPPRLHEGENRSREGPLATAHDLKTLPSSSWRS